ncbi:MULTISPECIES: hypothetical protein [unclassified Proteus (in: enterobacteria)]|uniref:hypothetical protein n=1 Tax=unclassified Proteus (in: enterobacteria) TaxID=257482 RepID=UPI001E5A948A|nr:MULTISPECIES: hypothetical protein [unclassified Proteus (in: enterobacteria)]
MMYELITIDVSSDTPKGLGVKLYKTHPRIGEWVEMDINEEGTMFEVVMVAHSDSGAGSDIYVRKLGTTLQAVKTLCHK